jgi:hypothetical protein
MTFYRDVKRPNTASTHKLEFLLELRLKIAEVEARKAAGSSCAEATLLVTEQTRVDCPKSPSSSTPAMPLLFILLDIPTPTDTLGYSLKHTLTPSNTSLSSLRIRPVLCSIRGHVPLNVHDLMCCSVLC